VHRTLLEKFWKRPFSEETLKKKVFCLLKGDISGIQDFVYDITSKGAAKSLKGRSFYLAMLAEVVAEWLLREEGLPLTNLLFSGGGHFYLLLPEKFLERLEERRIQLNRLLWEAHYGRLSLILSAVPLTYADFDRESFAGRWQEVELISREEKLKKLDALFADHYEQIFSPRWEGEQVCTVCQRAVNAGEEKCSFCAGFEKWGEALIKQPYLVKRWEREKPSDYKYGINHPEKVFKALSCEVFFSGKPVNDGLTYAVNNMDFLSKGADAWIFLPNHTPLSEKSFFRKSKILYPSGFRRCG
jgi:CRISPR-associated protein Csm1